MHEASSVPLRVAVISESERQRVSLKQILETNGLQVVADHSLSECAPGRLDREIADVLLIDLDESFESELSCLDVLIEQSSLPILFNDGDITGMAVEGQRADWGRKLVTKLTALVQSSPLLVPRRTDVVPEAGSASLQEGPVAAEIDAAEPVAEDSASAGPRPRSVADAVPQLRVVHPETWEQAERAQRVWVLGASIGGPQAVRRFLAALPDYLPVALLLVQHIDANFVALLREQLNRATRLQVVDAQEHLLLCHQQVVVAPVDRRIEINQDGRVELHAITRRTTYSPSIDLVMSHVAERYGPNAGAILFTGMGDDGAHGCRDIKEHGGLVWAQDADSCVISSMADHARRTGTVSFNGTPEELAAQLVKHLLV